MAKEDNVELARGRMVTVNGGWCRERPRVLFGQKEAWPFVVRVGAPPADSGASERSVELQFAAETALLRQEWRAFFECLNPDAPSQVRADPLASRLSEDGVLLVVTDCAALPTLPGQSADKKRGSAMVKEEEEG